MFDRNRLAFKTIGGDMVYPSQKEVDRVIGANHKALKAINSASNAKAFFGKKSTKAINNAKKGND
jgi:hypothetical protein